MISYRLIKRQGSFLFDAKRRVHAGISLCERKRLRDVEGLWFHSIRLWLFKAAHDLNRSWENRFWAWHFLWGVCKCEKMHTLDKWSYHFLKRQGTFLFIAKRIHMSEWCQHQSKARQHGRRCHHHRILSSLNDRSQLSRGTNDDRDHPVDVNEGCCKGCVRQQKVE